MYNVTHYKNLWDTKGGVVKNVYDVLNDIKTGVYKKSINKLLDIKDKKLQEDFKKSLSGCLFTGEFSTRSKDGLIQHNGLSVLDFDKYKSLEEVEEVKSKFKNDKYIFSFWTSPRRLGLKVLVKIPICKDDVEYKAYYTSLLDYYKCQNSDESTKDICRFCFDSFDSDLYINVNSHEYRNKIEEKIEIYNLPKINITCTNDEIFEKLIKWLNESESYIKGNRNNYLFKLASALNRFGVSKSISELYLNQYDLGKTEIDKIIDSAYSDTSNFGSSKFIDSDYFKTTMYRINSGVENNDIMTELIGKGLDRESAKKLIEYSEKKKEETYLYFWSVIHKEVKKQIETHVDIYPQKYINWLAGSGFYRYRYNQDYCIYVRLSNNIISPITRDEIKNFVFDFISLMPSNFDGITMKQLYDYCYKNNKHFFTDEVLDLLPILPNNFVKDTKNESFVFYKNAIIKITKDEYFEIPYSKINGFIWKSQINDRLFKKVDVPIQFDFIRFIYNIFKQDQKRVDSMMSIIGYMLHTYKDRSRAKCPVINDEILEIGSNGGTGKGILVNSLSYIRKVVTIDGKQEDGKEFKFQRITPDTKIIFIDDPKKDFNFENLFSVLTTGIAINKKFKDEIYIDFEESPKIIITTNYALKGDGNSHDRRKIEIELSSYYNKDRTPEDEFKKILFHDFNNEEWNYFDNFMLYCLQYYLENGFVESISVNLELKKLLGTTGQEFFDFAEENFNLNETYNSIVYRNKYMEEANYNKLTTQKFNLFLVHYAKYKNYELIRERVGTDKQGIFYFKQL